MTFFSQLKINKATFAPKLTSVREFYDQIEAKQAEQIVLTKKQKTGNPVYQTMRILLAAFFIVLYFQTNAQENSFPYGDISLGHLMMKSYDKDSSAAAVVLKEFGESYVSTDAGQGLIFEHHYVVKILKTDGLNQANIEIPLYRYEARSQKITTIKASSYNFENGAIKETKANTKNIFTENVNKYWEAKKLTIPNVRVGSVIEVQYKMEDPFFIENFHPWLFQSEIPKISSEYWATIPANYDYNITWKGFLKMTKNEAKLMKDAYDLGGRYKADCARYMFAMENIPAFIEEEYMTAKSNFLAGVNFELSEIRRFDGRVEKITRDWPAADAEILNNSYFGIQLKKGKDIVEKIEPNLIGVTDPLEKAKKIYSFVNSWYRWNEYFGKFSDDGIKKAFEKKEGNVGDINLTLLAALRYSGFDVEPLLISTRENGYPIELHPVLSDFNYVVAKLNLDGKVFLLDATDPMLPFGMLPDRCLNGKGRAFPDKKPSYWYDLKVADKYKTVSILNLEVQPSGKITGTVELTHFGYKAYRKRKEILSYGSTDEFVKEANKDWTSVTIEQSEITGTDNIEGTVKEKYTVEMEGIDNMNGSTLLLNPFFSGKIAKNPFRLTERMYPVDFGVVPDYTLILNLTYPKTVELVSMPEKNAFGLPGGSAKFLFDIIAAENKLTMNYVLSVNKPLFGSNEYQALKELYNRVIETQNTDLIFKKK